MQDGLDCCLWCGKRFVVELDRENATAPRLARLDPAHATETRIHTRQLTAHVAASRQRVCHRLRSSCRRSWWYARAARAHASSFAHGMIGSAWTRRRLMKSCFGNARPNALMTTLRFNKMALRQLAAEFMAAAFSSCCRGRSGASLS